FLPIFLGFLLPAAALGLWTIEQWSAAIDARFARLALNSFVLASGAAILCVILGGGIAYALRRGRQNRILKGAAGVVGLGYAVPGAVIAVGVALVLGGFDRLVNAMTGETALWLSGGLFALYFAYAVRFLPIALGAVESGFTRVTP